MRFEDGASLLLDESRGVYIPQKFIENFDWKAWGVSEENAKIIAGGPEPDCCYWEAWDEVIDGAEHTQKDGSVWRLHQDGSLWAVDSRVCWECSDLPEGRCADCLASDVEDPTK